MKTRNILLSILIVAGCGTAGYAAYRVWPAVREFVPAADQVAQPKLRFAVVGDNHGVNPIYEQILDDLDGADPTFLLNVADTTEYGTVEEFRSIKALEGQHQYPIYHVVGNHDIKGDPDRSDFTDAYGRAPCSSQDIEHVRLILLDNADRRVGFPDECLAWLDRELATVGERPVLLAYHRPFNLPFGDILGDDETRVSRASNDRFLAILERHGNVDYIFNGHLHTYIPYTMANIPAVVSGGGGDPAQTALGGARANFFHYLLVTVRGDQVSLEVKPVQLRD